MSENLKLQMLEKSKGNKQLLKLTIYQSYEEDNGYWMGYVKDYNKELVLLQCFDTYGNSKGVILEQIDSISYIDSDSDHINAMRYLIDSNNELNTAESFELELPEGEDWRYDILKQFEGTDQIIGLDIEFSNFIFGKVMKLTETEVVMQCLGKTGEYLGTTIYQILNFDNLLLDSPESRKRGMLVEWRKNRS